MRGLSVTDHSESAGSNYTELVAQTIEEESHNLGLGDTVSVAASAVTKDELSQHVGLSWRGEVVKVGIFVPNTFRESFNF